MTVRCHETHYDNAAMAVIIILCVDIFNRFMICSISFILKTNNRSYGQNNPMQVMAKITPVMAKWLAGQSAV